MFLLDKNYHKYFVFPFKEKTHRELCLEIGFPYPEEWDDPQSDKQFVEEVFISKL